MPVLPVSCPHFRRNILHAFFACALVVASGTAQAEWARAFTADATVYVDPLSFRKEGNLLKGRVLSELKSADTYLGRPYVSVRSLKEYDCKRSMVRTVHVSLHSGPMASGEVVAADLPVDQSWQPIWVTKVGNSLPKRTLSSLLNWVCGG